jgi:D-alanyl-D-alanine carboxypeptidase (penicillin-binding protein 5/6)
MNRLRLFLFPVVAIAFALTAHAATKQKPTRPSSTSTSRAETGATCKGSIVLDSATGAVIFEDNADEISPPASMTKLMTFAVLADKLQSGAMTLDMPVQVDASDAGMGGTQVYLDTRETFSVEELIYAMMIQSANDAAHALARTAAGSIPAFVQLMNAKAHEIGMTHSTFRTPHGLTSKRQSINEGDLTTPRDFALLCRYLILKTDVLKYTAVKHRDVGAARAKGPMHMDNHNKLLGRVIGVDGLKTGYTENAGYCLSATAERNGRRVIVVAMGCFGPKGHEIDMGRSRDLHCIELLDRGFAAIPPSAAPTPKPASLAPASTPSKSSVTKPAPAMLAPAAPATTTPATPVTPEVSPVQPAASASPVTSAAETPEAPAPSVKFELPQKTTKATK